MLLVNKTSLNVSPSIASIYATFEFVLKCWTLLFFSSTGMRTVDQSAQWREEDGTLRLSFHRIIYTIMVLEMKFWSCNYSWCSIILPSDVSAYKRMTGGCLQVIAEEAIYWMLGKFAERTTCTEICWLNKKGYLHTIPPKLNLSNPGTYQLLSTQLQVGSSGWHSM